MQIQVNEMRVSDYGTTHMELACNKTTAYVGIDKDGCVRVCKYNAAHRVWRGAGKFYGSKSKALESFKSAEMRAIIEAAYDAIQPVTVAH